MWRSFPARNFLSRAYSASLVAQAVKNLLAMQETWVWSWCWKDPLEKEITTHSSVLARTEEPGRLQSMGLQRVRHDWGTEHTHIFQDKLQLKVKALVTQLYPTARNPTDCSLPGSSVHGILQAKYWSGLLFPSPGDPIQEFNSGLLHCRQILTIWATRETSKSYSYPRWNGSTLQRHPKQHNLSLT